MGDSPIIKYGGARSDSKVAREDSATAALLRTYLDGRMKEREALLVRLGQIEDELIKFGRLSYRTKPPRN